MLDVREKVDYRDNSASENTEVANSNSLLCQPSVVDNDV